MIAGGAVRPVRRRFFVEMRLGRDEAAIVREKIDQRLFGVGQRTRYRRRLWPEDDSGAEAG